MKSICSGLLSQAFPQNLAKRNRAIAKCGSYTFPNSQEIPRPDQWPTHLPLFYRFYRVGVGREMGEEKKGIKKLAYLHTSPDQRVTSEKVALSGLSSGKNVQERVV